MPVAISIATFRRNALMNVTRNVYDVSLSTLNLNSSVCVDAEEIVVDERDSYKPSDFVQQKLQRLLPAAVIPVSCQHAGRYVRRYSS